MPLRSFCAFWIAASGSGWYFETPHASIRFNNRGFAAPVIPNAGCRGREGDPCSAKVLTGICSGLLDCGAKSVPSVPNIFESVRNCSAAIRLFCHPYAIPDSATKADEVPTRVCNDCGAQMKHLTDHRSAGPDPAERIFRCHSCCIVISERK